MDLLKEHLDIDAGEEEYIKACHYRQDPTSNEIIMKVYPLSLEGFRPKLELYHSTWTPKNEPRLDPRPLHQLINRRPNPIIRPISNL